MAKYILVNGIRIASEFVSEKLGRWTTLGPKFKLPTGSGNDWKNFQVCQCECGKIAVVCSASLTNGISRSCGCLRAETHRAIKIRHGMSDTPEFKSWQHLIDRTTNPKNKGYADYGGRGIKVCDRWLEPDGRGFVNFFSDVGPKPSPQHSIDRIDNNGNYEPGNCRWATRTEQVRNRRTSLYVTYNGITQHLCDWANDTGISYDILRHRHNNGWDIESMLTLPKNSKKRKR